MAKLYFYYAAMNAGKSTTLLQADYNYRERGMETMLWTAAFDDRSGAGTIGSRIALSAPAHTYSEDIDLFAAIGQELKRRDVHCVLVDEAQFLTQRHVAELCRVADELSIPVLCYGLRTDFQAKLFPGSAALLALADNLVELKAVCECGRKATMNLRVDQDGFAVARGAQTEIGGNDRYVALCRRHFFERLREVEAHQLNFGLPRTQQMLHGWIILDKPLGLGSTSAVSAVKRALREAGEPKTKVGHGGTLDPLASGVLPIALGEATKLAGRMLDATKAYDLTIKFGEQTDTLDLEGKVIATSDVRPTLAEVEAILPHFTGPIEQIPPAYSALKVDGERAYDLARKGVEVELKTRSVTVHALAIVTAGADSLTLSATVSKGTYIRSLARDIALALGSVGHVTMLRRTKAGPFTLESAISLDKLADAAKARALTRMVLPLAAGLDDIPALPVTPDQARLLRHGQMLFGIPATPGLYLACLAETPVALVEVSDDGCKVVRGFNLET